MFAFSLITSPLHARFPAGTWQFSRGDDFSGKALDLTKWSYNYPWGTTHNHDATMTAGNARFGDGTLSPVAERTGTGANFKSGAISSGRVNPGGVGDLGDTYHRLGSGIYGEAPVDPFRRLDWDTSFG